MNDYGFDYMNYITNIPNGLKYNQSQKQNLDYITNNQNKTTINYAKKQNTITQQNQNMYNSMQKKQLSDPTQGWLKGNLFKNLYEPYKNYTPKEPNPQNERQTLLYQLMQYKFALIELNLYLDTNPNDNEMIELYNYYLNIKKQITDKYESMYGPLTLNSDYLDKNNWTWKNNPWPWEVI